jgi:ATP-dependent protease HslVU (ClpYQ) peptidase subunit
MTTVAYKNGIIACDKQGTDGNVGMKASFKAVRTDDTVYLITGTLYKGVRFAEWLADGQHGKAPKLKNTDVLEFDMRSGKLVIYEGQSYPLPVEETMYAYGSGGQIALGAMAAGATAEEAVKIAIKYDVYTGGGVQVYRSAKATK